LNSFSPFTGREKELDRLEGMLENALEYDGSMVFVRGAIGVGKTRLLSHFIDRIRHRGFHILQGRSVRDSSRTFSPVTSMVENFLCHGDHSPKWIVKYLSPEIATHFLHLIPVLEDLYPIEVPEAAQPESTLSTAFAFQEFFQNLSRSRPLVMVMDDIQWMSPDGLQLLRNLAYRITDLPILLIAGVRSGSENPSLDSLTEELNTQRLVQTIDLDNLSYEEISRLLDSKMNEAAPEHFKQWLSSLSKGNPLFIEEILKTLMRQNVIHSDSDEKHWKVEDDYRDFRVSETLESVVRYRLGQLDNEELKTIESAAVIGDSFSLNTLLKLLKNSQTTDAMRSVNILSSLGMLETSKGYCHFSHPLIRRILYDGMDHLRRRRLHRDMVTILKDTDQDKAGIAWHLTRDLLPEEETAELALRLFHLAIDLKDISLDYTSSWECMKTAWRVAQNAELVELDRLRILAEFDYFAWINGQDDTLSCPEAEALIEDLIEHKLYREAAITCRPLFHVALNELDMKKAENYLKKGISLLEKTDPFYWFFRVEDTLLKRRKGLLKESLEEANILIDEIPQDKAPEALYKVIASMSLVSFLMGDVKVAYHHARRAREIVLNHNLSMHSANSRLNLGLILMTMGNLDSALGEFTESKREAELIHREPLVGINLLNIGHCYYYMGDFKQALKYLEKAQQKGLNSNVSRLKPYALRCRARIHLKTGEIEEALNLLQELETNPLAEQMESDLKIIRATIELEQDHPREAMELIEKTVNLAKEAELGTKLGQALGVRGLIKLHEGNIEGALEDLAESESWLLEKGEVPLMSEILVNFGLKLKGDRGEEILNKGLELLLLMNATAAIEDLAEKVERSGEFKNVLKRIMDRSEDPRSKQIEILTFGGLSIRRPGELTEVAKKDWGYAKARELLALLLLTTDTKGFTRELLASHLWPDAPESKSTPNLRVALTYLRKVVGEEVILQDGQYLSLNRDIIRTDLWDFVAVVEEWRTLLRDGKAHTAEDRVQRAMELYKGDFLPEFYSLPLEDEQFRLQNLMRELLLWMAQRSMERVEYRHAVRYARKLLAMDPCSEKACHIIMEGLTATGDRSGAIRQYKRLEKSLAQEFNTEPEAEIAELYKQLIST